MTSRAISRASTAIRTRNKPPSPTAPFQSTIEKGEAGGYASLDGSATIPDAQLPTTVARDTEITAAVAAHVALPDPHSQYALESALGALAAKSSVATADLDNDAVTYAKLQNVSATDKLLGRATAGAGDVEEITCTAAARSILDDATVADIRATLSAPSTSETAIGVAGASASAQVAGVLDGVATTILATGSTPGLYIIYMTTSDAYSAWAVVHNPGSGTGCTVLRTDSVNPNFVITATTGGDIKVTATGAGTRTVSYRYIRI